MNIPIPKPGTLGHVESGGSIEAVDSNPARIGRVWYAMLVGGASTDLPSRKILPEVLSTGYEATIRRHAIEARNFGAVNMVILNPGGTVFGEMEFDQWPRCYPDTHTRARMSASFRRGVWAAMGILGATPMVYLGSVKLAPGINQRWDALDDAELAIAVEACVDFIPNECPIAIDGSGAGDAMSWRVAMILNARGHMVGCEPWPLIGSYWASDQTTFGGITNSGLLRQYFDPSTTQYRDYGSRMDLSRGVCERQIILTAESPEPGISELGRWMRIGMSIAVKPGPDCKYHGMNAREIERAASR